MRYESSRAARLSAFGLERWLVGSRTERVRMLWVISAVALIPVMTWVAKNPSYLSHLGAALAELPDQHYSTTSGPVVALGSVWRWLLICLFGVAALTVGAKVRSASLVVLLVVAVTGTDLITLNRGFHGSIPMSEAVPPVPPTIKYLQQHAGAERVLGAGLAIPADLETRYGLQDPRIGVIVPPTLRNRELWTGLDGIGGDQEFYETTTPESQKLADIFDARYILLPPGSAVPRWLKTVDQDAGGIVAVNTSALPRAWVVYNWRHAVGQAAALSATITSSRAQLFREPSHRHRGK
jgi:hypothetical protein